MIFGFLIPGEPLFIDFIIPKIQKISNKIWKPFEQYCCISGLPELRQFGKRRAPKNPEDPFNQISQIMDMGQISIKKNEWVVVDMSPISITKHRMTFLEF